MSWDSHSHQFDKLRAVVCLLAAVLLWTPLWASGVEAMNADCCNGVHCAIKGHSHHSMAKAKEAPAEASDMHCDHESKSTLRQCSVDCCRTQESFFVASIVFMLPSLEMVLGAPNALRLTGAAKDLTMHRPSAPPDQPPRSLPS